MFTGVRLRQFRSYNDQSFELESGVNIVVGPNASGKSNLLEALYVATQGSSYRGRDQDLIQHGKPWARIDVESAVSPRIIKLKQAKPIDRSIQVQNNQSKRMRSQDKWPVVLFEPEHLRLLSGSPRLRRLYIDQLIGQLLPEFQPKFRRYSRVLQQRNSLLKQGKFDDDQMFVWNLALVELGEDIVRQRIDLIAELNKVASTIYSKLAGANHTVEFEYIPSVTGDFSTNFHKHLSSSLDSQTGFTQIGPHRDDFAVRLNGQLSQSSASRGENRTLVLVAKLVELDLLEKRFGHKPLLLLDDVFSELDGRRRRELANYLSGYQSLITTTDADAVVEHFLQNKTKIIAIQKIN